MYVYIKHIMKYIFLTSISQEVLDISRLHIIHIMKKLDRKISSLMEHTEQSAIEHMVNV